MSSAPPSPAICHLVVRDHPHGPEAQRVARLDRCEAQQRDRDRKQSEQKGRKLRRLRDGREPAEHSGGTLLGCPWRFAGAIASAAAVPEARSARAGRALPAVRAEDAAAAAGSQFRQRTGAVGRIPRASIATATAFGSRREPAAGCGTIV